jgi:hypothetical protein
MLSVLKPTPITDALFVSSSLPETDYAAYVVGTTYAIGNRVIYNHRCYESLANANTGHTPSDVGSTWWNDLGPTSRWASFDYKNSTYSTLVTSGGNPTLWQRVKPGVCNGVYVMGMSGVKTVRVQMYNGATLVYDQSALLDNTFIGDAYMYYFEPFDIRSDMVFWPLPPYYNAEIVVTLTPAVVGDTVKVSGIQYGTFVELGDIRYDTGVDFKDYSIKESDTFGQYTLIERDFSTLPKYLLYVERSQIRRVFSTIISLRATPCVWIMSDDYLLTPFNAFGFPRAFSLVLPFYAGSYFSLDVESLT